MGSRKKSNTASLVEGGKQPSERLSLEETWPSDHGVDINATEMPIDEAYDPNVIPPQSTAHPDNQQPYLNQRGDAIGRDDEVPMSRAELGLSSSGPFIAPAPVAPPDAPKTRKVKETVASMPRELAFAKFRDSLFTLCFKFGFKLDSGSEIYARDVSDAKGSAKRAMAVAKMADLELVK